MRFKLFAFSLAVLIMSSSNAQALDRIRILMTTQEFLEDPTKARGYQQFQVIGLTLDTLVQINDHGEIESLIAKSWTINKDGTEYEFKISEKARFCDGSSITANNVVDSLEAHLKSNSPSSVGIYLKPLLASENAIQAIDSTTLRIKLKQRYQPLLKLLSFNGFGVYKKQASGKIISSGPYCFSQNQGTKATLIKNEHYGFRQSGIHGFEFSIERDTEKTLQLLRSNSIDVAMGSPIEGALASEGTFQITSPAHGLIVNNIVLNLNEPQFADGGFRKDLGRLFKFIASSPGVLSKFDEVSDHLLPKGILPAEFYLSKISPLAPADFAKKHKPNRLRVVFPLGILTETAHTKIVSLLKDAGFKVDFVSVKGQAYAEPLDKGNFSVAFVPYQGLLADPCCNAQGPPAS